MLVTFAYLRLAFWVSAKWLALYSIFVMGFAGFYFFLPADSFHQANLESDAANKRNLQLAGEVLALDLGSGGLSNFTKRLALNEPFSELTAIVRFVPNQLHLNVEFQAWANKQPGDAYRPYTSFDAQLNLAPDNYHLNIRANCPECRQSILPEGVSVATLSVGADSAYVIAQLIRIQNDILPQ